MTLQHHNSIVKNSLRKDLTVVSCCISYWHVIMECRVTESALKDIPPTKILSKGASSSAESKANGCYYHSQIQVVPVV